MKKYEIAYHNCAEAKRAHQVQNNLFKRCVRAKQPRTIKTIIYNDIFTSLGHKKFKVRLNTESLSMKWNRRLPGLIMFAFNFGVESLEQSVKLSLLIIFNFLGNSLL